MGVFNKYSAIAGLYASSRQRLNGAALLRVWPNHPYPQVGASKLVDGFYWDDTWYPGGVGDDPYKNMVVDMGLTTAELLQLTASYDATMLALVQ